MYTVALAPLPDCPFSNPFTNYGMRRVHFSEDALYYWQTGGHQLRRVAAPDFVVNTIDFYGWRDNAIRPSISPRTTFSGIRHVVGDGKSAIAASAAANTNLALPQETRIGTGLSMVAYAASNYATGWMPGKIKLAALADTDQTDLVSSEQITNGTFDTDMTGWVSGSGDADYAEVIDGALRVYGNAYIYQAVPTVAGQTYRAQFEIIGGTGGVADFRIGYCPNGTQLYDHPANVGVGVYETYFTATGPTTRVTLKTHFQPGALSDFMDFDNISMRPGIPDRSVNNSGITVLGRGRGIRMPDLGRKSRQLYSERYGVSRLGGEKMQLLNVDALTGYSAALDAFTEGQRVALLEIVFCYRLGSLSATAVFGDLETLLEVAG